MSAVPSWIRLCPSPLRTRIENRPELLKALENISWLFLDKILRMSVGLVVGVWLARYLGPAQFGQFSYAIAFVGMFAVFAEFGLNGIVVRNVVREPEATNTILGTAFVMQLLGGLLAVVLIAVTIFWLHPKDEFTRIIVGILSLSLIFKSTDVIKYWFESQVQSRYAVWVENAAFILMAAVKVSMILGNANLIIFVWITLAETLLVAIGLLAIYALQGERIVSWCPRIERGILLLKDSWPLFLAGLAVTIYMRVDIIMLDQMIGSNEVGIYSAATRLSEIWYFIPVAIMSSVAPSIIRQHNVDRKLYVKRLYSLYFYMSWFAVFVSTLIYLYSDELVMVLYGKEYGMAAKVLSVHMWASIAVFMGVASSQYLLVEHLQIISLYRTLIGLLCNVLLNLFLIPIAGAMGAAISTLISYFVSVYSLVLFKRTREHGVALVCAPFRRN